MTNAPQKPVPYEFSEARRAYLRKLSERLSRTVEFASDDKSRQGEKADHTYSRTAEENRIASFPRAPIA